MPFGFRRGLRPRHPGGGSLRFGARGEESVAYRLAGAVRAQPRGCKGRSPLHEITLVSPSPTGKGEIISSFRRGLRPRHPGGGSLRFGARGEESVVYRLAGAVRVQPRGCKGRSPLHEITLVSPSPPGKGQGDGGKTPFGFRRGLSPGGADSTLDIPLPVGFAGTHRFKSIQIQEKFWGVWGTLSRVPQRFSSVSPPPPPAIAEVQFFRKVVPSLVSTSVTPRSER